MMDDELEYGMQFVDEVMVGSLKQVRRHLITPMGGYFPVLTRLRNGKLAAVFRMGDYHVGQRGRLELSLSKDGGKTWTMPRTVTASQTDDRNPAFCQLKDGTLLVAFARVWGYENGLWKKGGMKWQILVTRSTNEGREWSKPELIEVPFKGAVSPYGKMLQTDDGTILMSVYSQEYSVEGSMENSYILRSEDNGFTWKDLTIVAKGYNETALLQLPDGDLLAALRGPCAQGGGECVAISRSRDMGYTWSEPRQVTVCGEHPGDLCYLRSGNILLTFGHRRVPYGVHAVISPDDGQSWMFNKRVALVSYATDADCGYPSSVQLDDGTIYTAYYSATCLKYREWGIHAAGVSYTEDVFSV
jgi:hypothetical protein